MTVSIEPLYCGTLTAAMSNFEAGASEDPVTIPVPSWLIRHPKGLVLVDCGMHTDLAAKSDYLDLVSLFFDVGLSPDQLVANQLAAVGVDAADIDVVILTHLHFDHTGGLSQIPNAKVVVHADEWAAGASDEQAATMAFMPSDYRLGHDVTTVDGDHDLFGDGLVSCIPTPGHTPGHQSVRVRLADQEVVLCGDCAYFENTLATGALPPGGYDLAAQAESVRTLQAMGAKGARLIPGHDPVTFPALPAKLV